MESERQNSPNNTTNFITRNRSSSPINGKSEGRSLSKSRESAQRKLYPSRENNSDKLKKKEKNKERDKNRHKRRSHKSRSRSRSRSPIRKRHRSPTFEVDEFGRVRKDKHKRSFWVITRPRPLVLSLIFY
jgi:hypothetical protein